MLWRVGLLLALVCEQVLGEGNDPRITDEGTHAGASSGVSQSRMVGGWRVRAGQFPHDAALRPHDRTGTHGWFGGALVSQHWILTTGFTVFERTAIDVRLGFDRLFPEHAADAAEWRPHPDFDPTADNWQLNNIGMVKLSVPVVYNDNVKSIRVQPSADAFRSYVDEVLITTNFGSNGFLEWMFVRGITDAECRSAFPRRADENTVCVRYFNSTAQSPCTGGGSPLVHEDPDGVQTLIGLFAVVPTRSCTLGLPTGFTRPGPYHSWLRQVAGINFDNSDEGDTTTAIPESTSTALPSITTEEPIEENPATITSTPKEPTTVIPTTEESVVDDPTTKPPPPTKSTTVIPTTEESVEDNPTTKPQPDSIESEEETDKDDTTIKPPPESSEESESEEKSEEDKSDEDSNYSSVESKERPSIGIIKRKRVGINVNVQLYKKKIIKKKHKRRHPRPRKLHKHAS